MSSPRKRPNEAAEILEEIGLSRPRNEPGGPPVNEEKLLAFFRNETLTSEERVGVARNVNQFRLWYEALRRLAIAEGRKHT